MGGALVEVGHGELKARRCSSDGCGVERNRRPLPWLRRRHELVREVGKVMVELLARAMGRRCYGGSELVWRRCGCGDGGVALLGKQ